MFIYCVQFSQTGHPVPLHSTIYMLRRIIGNNRKSKGQFTSVKRTPSVEMDLNDLHASKEDMERTEYDRTKSLDVKTIENREKTYARPIKERWQAFMAETSCHGLKFLGNPATPMLVKFIYGTVVGVMIVSMYLTVFELAANVFKYRSVTRTEVFVDPNLTFPTVTFCNMCPFNFQGKNQSDPLYSLLAKLSIYSKYLPDMDVSNESFTAFFGRSMVDLYDEYSMGIGLFFAEYDGERLSEDDFEPLDTDNGRCYQFNGLESVKANGPRLASSNDRMSGLRAMLNIRQNDYGIVQEGAAGIRMFISHHKSVPPLETHGLQIMPGTSSLVGLKMQQISFLPSPYKSYGSEHCVDVAEDSPELVAKMKNGRVYSFEACRSQCVAYKASMNCSCYMPTLVLADLRPCTALDLMFGCYMKSISRISAQVEKECDCPRPCSLTIYDMTLSMSQLPSTVVLESGLNIFNATDDFNIRDNVLEVRVFFATSLIRLEKHEPEYTVESFISSLGGQMGIYLGASIITLVEALEMLTYLIQATIRRIIRCFSIRN